MATKWTMFICIRNEENRKLMLKCAKICDVSLEKATDDDIYVVSDPMPSKKNWNKFLNTLEERKIVTDIDCEVVEEDCNIIYLSDFDLDEKGENK